MLHNLKNINLSKACALTSQVIQKATHFSRYMSEPVSKKLKIMPELTVTSSVDNSPCHKAENGASKGDVTGREENGAKQNNVENFTDGSRLYIKKLSTDAYTPVRGSENAAGFDLHSACDVTIPAKDKCLVSTQLAITVPKGSYGRIAPRSGLATKHFIDVGAGVIDRDYTGEVKVLLFNFSAEDYEVEKGSRIAQLVIEKIFMPEIVEVDDLEKTKRGDTGFGASGK